MPFLPYPGMMAFFSCLFHLPVVLALMDRFTLGLRMPNFTFFLPIRFVGYSAEFNLFTILPGA